MVNRVCHWYDEFTAQVSLIYMTDFFTAQIESQIHPTCDALYHMKHATSGNPFPLKTISRFLNVILHHLSLYQLTMPV